MSTDFSSNGKLLFGTKPLMLKLAWQKGHFKIAYSPLISTDVNAKRNLITEGKFNFILFTPTNNPAL
jgi:ribonuclease P/MRP protein subunit RPP1